jgi:hypothetical protein
MCNVQFLSNPQLGPFQDTRIPELILKDRQLLALGSPNDVVTPERLRRVYGVEVHVADLHSLAGRRVCVPDGSQGARDTGVPVQET